MEMKKKNVVGLEMGAYDQFKESYFEQRQFDDDEFDDVRAYSDYGDTR